MTSLLFKAQKYMNGEDALTTKGLIGKRKKEEASDSQHKKKYQKDHSLETKSPFVMHTDKILMQIKGEPDLKWWKP